MSSTTNEITVVRVTHEYQKVWIEARPGESRQSIHNRALRQAKNHPDRFKNSEVVDHKVRR